MQPRISVIVPSIGRDTLQAALDSCVGAFEVIVEENQDGDHGYGARTRAMSRATGTHLAFLDDDDVFTPNAIHLFERFACDKPVIFKMDDPLHGIIWRDRELRLANVGTPMFLVPNRPDELGVWEPYAHGRCGDFAFIKGCVEKMGDPIWVDEVVCVVRPHERTPSITVVTPWHDHLHLLADYEQAMNVGRPEGLIVVDNASDPPVPLPGIRLEENTGFCYANNLGLADATTDAVLFLNSDIRATSADWLSRIRQALEPGVLVGAQLRHNQHAAVDGGQMPYLDGWCLAGMRDDLVDLGGWDEDLMEPAYYSDNLLCLEARAAGMGLREVRTGLIHKTNGSTDPYDSRTVEATAHNQRVFRDRARQLIGVAA